MFLTPVQMGGVACFLLTIPIGLAFVITVRHFKKDKSRHSLFFMLAWLMYVLWGLFNGFAYFLDSPAFTLASSFITIPLGFFVVVFLDGITRVSLDPLKIAIVTALSTVKTVLALSPNPTQVILRPDGFEEVSLSEPLLLAGSLLTLTLGIWYVFFMARIHWHAPRKMRVNSRLGLWGAILMGLGGPIYMIVAVNIVMETIGVDILPIFVGIGALLTALAFTRQPQLAYILPFQAYRLTVIDNASGIPLFSHTWNPGKELIDSTLFSGMLQGISGILQESLQKGNLREIHLDQAILLLQRNEKMPVTCVLVATKSTPSLREALQAFADQFSLSFCNQLREINRTDAFTPAEGLISACFPFVPEYD